MLGEVLAVEQREEGTLIVVCLDADTRTLTELTWRPGTGVTTRTVALTGPVMRFAGAASLSPTGLLLAKNGTNEVVLVDRQTGGTTGLTAETPAVITPDGKAVVSATDHGLLRRNLSQTPGQHPYLHWIRPMLVTELDNPDSMATVPGERPDQFSLVVGCYGRVALITVTNFGAYAIAPKVVLLEPKLPYDPMYIAWPVPLSNVRGTQVFVTDAGRAGLVAVELSSGRMEKCPLEDQGYGAVRAVVPRLDGRACLLATRDDRLWAWVPGRDPVAVEDIGGWPMLWHGPLALVCDGTAEGLREARLEV
jgi:hypothetical protein